MSAAAAAAADSPGSLGERLQKVLFLRLHTVKLASQVSRDLTAAARKGGRERCALALAIAIDVAAGAMLVTLAAQAAMDMAPRSLHDTAAGAITTLCGTMVTELQGLLESLMEAPGGLKLNGPLSKFLGSFTLFLLDMWTAYIRAFTQQLPGLLHFVLHHAGWAGASMVLALCQDLVVVTTLHLRCFYVYTLLLKRLLWAMLAMLSRVFRGKKFNPLRQRVDSLQYDTEQQLIGTVMFAICVFLYPTMVAFHLVFAAIRLLQLSVTGGLGLVLGAWRCATAGVGNLVVGVWSPVPTDPPQFDLLYTTAVGDAAERSRGELSAGKGKGAARLQRRYMSLWDRFGSGWTTQQLVAHVFP